MPPARWVFRLNVLEELLLARSFFPHCGLNITENMLLNRRISLAPSVAVVLKRGNCKSAPIKVKRACMGHWNKTRRSALTCVRMLSGSKVLRQGFVGILAGYESRAYILFYKTLTKTPILHQNSLAIEHNHQNSLSKGKRAFDGDKKGIVSHTHRRETYKQEGHNHVTIDAWFRAAYIQTNRYFSRRRPTSNQVNKNHSHKSNFE